MKNFTIFRKIEIGVLVACGVGSTLIMFINAIARYAFQNTFVWAEECIRILFVWAMFIAITDAFFSNGHIGFQNLAEKNRLTRFLSKIMYNLVLAVVGIILGSYGYTYTVLTGNVPLPGTNLPTAIFMIPGVIAGFVWFGLGIVRTIIIIKNFITGKEA